MDWLDGFFKLFSALFFLDFKELESTKQSAGGCTIFVLRTVLFWYHEELRFRRIRCFRWRIYKRTQNYTPDFSSATQKDAKPMNNQTGEPFESRSGILVSGKNGQREFCSFPPHWGEKHNRNSSQGYKHWWFSVEINIYSSEHRTCQDLLDPADSELLQTLRDILQHLEKLFLWDTSLSAISKSTLSSSNYCRKEIGSMLKWSNGLIGLLLHP